MAYGDRGAAGPAGGANTGEFGGGRAGDRDSGRGGDGTAPQTGGGRGGRRSGRTGATARDTTRAAGGDSLGRANRRVAPRRSRTMAVNPSTPAALDYQNMHLAFATDEDIKEYEQREVEDIENVSKVAGGIFSALGGGILGMAMKGLSKIEVARFRADMQRDPLGTMARRETAKGAIGGPGGERDQDILPPKPAAQSATSGPATPASQPQLPTTQPPPRPAADLATPGTEIPSFLAGVRSDIDRSRRNLAAL